MSAGADAPGDDDPDTTATAVRRGGRAYPAPDDDVEATLARVRPIPPPEEDTLQVRSIARTSFARPVSVVDEDAPRTASSPRPGNTDPGYPIRTFPGADLPRDEPGARPPQAIIDGAAVERAIRGKARRRAITLGVLIVVLVLVSVLLLVALLVLPR